MNVHSVSIVENTLSRTFCGFFWAISYGQLPVFVAAFYLNNSRAFHNLDFVSGLVYEKIGDAKKQAHVEQID